MVSVRFLILAPTSGVLSLMIPGTVQLSRHLKQVSKPTSSCSIFLELLFNSYFLPLVHICDCFIVTVCVCVCVRVCVYVSTRCVRAFVCGCVRVF